MPPKTTPSSKAQESNPFNDFVSALAPPKEERKSTADVQDSPWEIIPPSLDLFVTGSQYLGLPPLSTRQSRALHEGLGQDGTKLFEEDNKYNELILSYGKGSGKDHLASIVIAYVAYVVLCLKDPAGYFGLVPGDNLDIINVATRKEQAMGAFFNKLRARIERPCFGRWVSRFTKSTVTFPQKNINLISVPSQEQKWEGYNVLAWVMDEADAFVTLAGHENALKVYNVLRSSAVSRFPRKRWVGMIISYPRQREGFLFKKIRQARLDDSAYVDVGAIWEVHPFYDPDHPMYQNIPFVKVSDKWTVPEPLADDFRNDPGNAAMLYACQPPPVSGAFFEFPELVDQCVDPSLRQAFVTIPDVTYRPVTTYTFESGEPQIVDRAFVARRIVTEASSPVSRSYFVHCDPGEVRDAFSLAMGHSVDDQVHKVTLFGEEFHLRKVVIDLLITWEPSSERPVDYMNVLDVLTFINERYPLAQVTFDKFQSQMVIQRLLELGINARQESFSRRQQFDIFRLFKVLVYNAMVSWSERIHQRGGDLQSGGEGLGHQLKNLVRKGDQITHVENISAKDDADAVATVAWFASGGSLGRVGLDILSSMSATAGQQSGIAATRFR